MHLRTALAGLQLVAFAVSAAAAETAAAPAMGAAGPKGLCIGPPQFDAAPFNPCTGTTVRLAVVGDLLMHEPLQDLGYKIGFRNIWFQPMRILAKAALAVANLETPVAPGRTAGGGQAADPGPATGTGVYTGFPLFNAHPVLLGDLAAGGVDLVTTANNHALDRGSAGVDLTLAEVARAGLSAVGSVRSDAPRSFVVRRGTAAGTLSFVACSFSTNGIPDPHRQVLTCHGDRAELIALVRREAADPAVAGVIVLPHWGTEMSNSASARQRGLARDLAAAGATAVIGTHPHTVQPLALLSGSGGTRVPVVYSTGNFIAVQNLPAARIEQMAVLDLCRGATGRAVAGRAGWIAMQMTFTGRGYWVDIAPRGTPGYYGDPERFMARIAPGFSAQPAGCR